MTHPSDPSKFLHEKVTLETDIPPLPRKSDLIARPDFHQHDSSLKGLESRISSVEQQIESVKTALKDARKTINFDYCEANLAGTEDSLVCGWLELVESKEKLLQTYSELTEECKALIDDQRRLRKDMLDTCADDTEENVGGNEDSYARILAEYERKQTEIDRNATKRGEIAADLTKIYAKLDEIRVKPSDSPAVPKDSDSDQIAALKSQRDALSHSLEDLKSKRKSLVSAFREKDQAYKDQQRLIRAIEQANLTQKRLRDQEERKKAQRLREEEQARSNSFQKDITMCDGIVRLLERVAGGCGKGNRGEEEAEKTPPLTPVEAGMELVLDKKLREAQEGLNWFRNVQSKPKKKRERKQPTEQPSLNLSVEMLAFLAEKSIKIPANSGEIAETVGALKLWRSTVDSAKAGGRGSKRTETLGDEGLIEDFPSLKGSEITRSRAFTEEIGSLEDRKEKGHRGGRRGKRGRYRYGREGRKGSEVGSEEQGDGGVTIS